MPKTKLTKPVTLTYKDGTSETLLLPTVEALKQQDKELRKLFKHVLSSLGMDPNTGEELK